MFTSLALLKKFSPYLLFFTLLTNCGGNNGEENIKPVADSGNNLTITKQINTVALNGLQSYDADGDKLTFLWQILSAPSGSTAYLSDSASPTTSLKAINTTGTYQITLVVNDGVADSTQDTTVISVIDSAKNVILLIGDGMGLEQIKAAGMFKNGLSETLFFENFQYQGEVITTNIYDEITDSAAAGTAMATGTKVENGRISQNYPGDGVDLPTFLEIAAQHNASTGLVTTTTISHATPATFGSHVPSRNNYLDIINAYINQTKPNVLFGGAQYVDPIMPQASGYLTIENSVELSAIDTEASNNVWGQFGETHLPYEWDGLGNLPHLSETTQVALDILANNPDGFFLMVEGGRIDHAGHSNDIKRNIFETIEFANAAETVFNWAKDRNDTLIIVTADHETGGLEVTQNNGLGIFPDVIWRTTGHTAQNVPVFSWGVNSHLLTDTIDNTEIFTVMKETFLGEKL